MLYFKEAKADKICCAKLTCYFADQLLYSFSKISGLSIFFCIVICAITIICGRLSLHKVVMRFIRSASLCTVIHKILHKKMMMHGLAKM